MTDSGRFREAWAVCSESILSFCKLMNFEPWSQQKEILLAVQELTLAPNAKYDVRRLIAKSGQGLGKTALLTIVGLWRHLRSPGTLTLVIAPTERQAKTVFFAEMRRTLDRGPEFIRDILELTATTLTVKGNPTWKMMGVCASSPETAAGFHHGTMTILIEEISGIEDIILDAFFGTASQDENLIVGIGNPTQTEGYLYTAFMMPKYKADVIWPFRFTLSKLVLAKERPELAAPGPIEAARAEHGEDSNFWRVRILGEFPNTGGEAIIGRKWLEDAALVPAWMAIQEAPDPTIRTIGVDFSGAGPHGDENAAYFRAGNAIVHKHTSNCEPYEMIEYIFAKQKELDWSDDATMYVPDAVGVGQGMLHFFDKAKKMYLPYGSHYVSSDPEYANLETKAWFRAKEVLTKQVPSVPYDEDLFDQLTARHSMFDTKNRTLVEPKKAYMKRTKRPSPNNADAFVQCFAADDLMLTASNQVI